MQSPGNHEFDDRIAGFLPFLENITYPIICANCLFEECKEVNSTIFETLNSKIKPYIIQDVGNVKIGIIGYLTTDTGVIL